MDNRIKDAFDGVHAEAELKESTMAYLRAKTEKPARRTYSRGLAAALACLAIALLGLGGRSVYMTPTSAISVDVNPSIELLVNRFDRIVSVEGRNDDGVALAAAVELQNLSYTEGLDVLLKSDALAPYLQNDGLVSITVIGDTEEKSAQMQGRITSCGFASTPTVECQCGNPEDVAAAHDAGLSFGKYRAYMELQALDPELSVDDVHSMTMRQIKDMTEALCDDASSESGCEHGGEQHHGGKGG